MPQAIASFMPLVTGPHAVDCADCAASSAEAAVAVAQFVVPLNVTQTWHSTAWTEIVDQMRNATNPAMTSTVMRRFRALDTAST